MYLQREEFDRHLSLMRQTPRLTVDTEGTLNHPYSTTWGISTSSYSISEYFGFNHIISHPITGENLPQSWLRELKDVIESHPCLVMHNAKNDLRALKSIGIDYKGPFYCTMLMAHMVNENWPSKSLDWLSTLAGNGPKAKTPEMEAIIKFPGWPYIPVNMMRAYADHDSFITEQLFNWLLPQFQEQEFDGDLWQVEQDFCRLLMKIENTGVSINESLAERELERGLKIMKDLEKELGFNPNSPKQLEKFLIGDLGLPIVKRNKPTDKHKAEGKPGSPSFDKEAMEIYDEILSRTGDKRARQVLAYRGWSKTTSSNYKPYLELRHPQDGRLRCNYKQHGTKSCRLSCAEPNLQQIPREGSNDWNGHTKAAITVEKGRKGIEFDYAQLEFRVGAAYGAVTRLIDAFNDPIRDIFDEMSIDLGMGRQDTKTLNYTLQFGGGADRISQVFGTDYPAARTIIRNYYNQYPGLKEVADYAENVCRERGYIKYWTSRRRHISNPDEFRKAFNSLCQGGAFEIVKRAMLAIDDAGLNNSECQMDLQVHDSVRFSIEEGKEHIYVPEIKNIMENVKKFYDFGVKFKVDAHEWAADSKDLIAA